jgi:hypothetical protein
MPNEIPIPSDLNHLIEKRDRSDRRVEDRREPESDSTSETETESISELDRRDESQDPRQSARRQEE